MTSRFLIPSSAFAVAILVACAAKAPPPAPAPEPKPRASADAGTTTTASVSADDAKRAHERIVSACSQEAPAAFCECVADHFDKHLTKQDLEREEADPKRVKELWTGALEACTPAQKTELVKACAGDDDFARDYCDCFFAKLLEAYDVAQLFRPEIRGSDLFLSNSLAAAKLCDAKMPAGKVESEFMKTCARSPTDKKFCACAWKQMRSVMTPSELFVERANESPDFKRGQEKVARECPRK